MGHLGRAQAVVMRYSDAMDNVFNDPEGRSRHYVLRENGRPCQNDTLQSVSWAAKARTIPNPNIQYGPVQTPVPSLQR